MPQYSGLEVKTSLRSRDFVAKKATLTITDNSKAATSRGVPDGTLAGSVEANVTMEVDTFNLKILLEDAKQAGSFRGIQPFDFMAYMNKVGADMETKIEAFGLKPKLTDLLDADTDSEEGLIHKIECPVTSPDFVHINGIPYLAPEETEHISN